MTTKVFNKRNYQTKDNSLIYYTNPKNINKGILLSKAYYLEDDEKMPIYFETDPFRLSNPIHKTEKGNYYVNIRLDEFNQAFYEFVEELDELGKGKTWENCKKWFGFDLDFDLIDSWYKTEIIPSSKGFNYMKLKLDSENLLVKNQFGSSVDLHFPENSKLKVKLRYDGIAFYQQLYKPIFVVTEITYHQQNKVDDEDSFYTHENSYPTFKLNNLGSETEPEEDYEFEKNNEEDIRKLVHKNDEIKHSEESTKTDNEESDFGNNEESSSVKNEELSSNAEMEEVIVKNEEEYEEIQREDENQILENEIIKQNVEGVRSHTTTETEEIHEILSKTLTKAISENNNLASDEPTTNLEYKDGDTIEVLRRKLEMSKSKITKLKTEKSVDSFTSESKGKTTKLILNNNKVKTVSRHKSLE